MPAFRRSTGFVAVSRYFTQDVLPIVRLVVFTDFVKNNDLLHVSSPLFAWRNCQTCNGALTRLLPRMEGMKDREPYFLKVLIIRTDYEVPGHTGISGRLAMVVRLWTHVSLSQALGYRLAYLCIPVKLNRKSPYFRAFSGFLYWIKKFSSPKCEIVNSFLPQNPIPISRRAKRGEPKLFDFSFLVRAAESNPR